MTLKVQVFEGFRTYAFKGEKGTDVEGAKQEAYVHVPGQRFPVRMDVSLPKGAPPIRPGEYAAGPGCYSVKDGVVIVRLKAAELLPLEGSRAQVRAG